MRTDLPRDAAPPTAPGGPPDATRGCLYLIRHGRTSANGERYVGWGDEPLNAQGLAQARAIAELLHAADLDAIHASPLGRAVRTAQPLRARAGVPLHLHEALREIHYGHYQGLSKAERPLRLRHAHRREPMPGGESLLDVYRRTEPLARLLREQVAAGRRLAVVGHFWSNRMLLAALRGTPFDHVFDRPDYKPANGSVCRLAFGAAGTDTGADASASPGAGARPALSVGTGVDAAEAPADNACALHWLLGAPEANASSRAP